GDVQRVEVLFRQSGLMREKWDQSCGEVTYGLHMVSEAARSVSRYYTGPVEPLTVSVEDKHGGGGSIHTESSYCLSLLKQLSVLRAVANNRPWGDKAAERCLVALARDLKALPHLADAAATHLADVVRYWHDDAGGALRTTTTEQAQALFARIWPCVRF